MRASKQKKWEKSWECFTQKHKEEAKKRRKKRMARVAVILIIRIEKAPQNCGADL
jgi:hypothetical protein